MKVYILVLFVAFLGPQAINAKRSKTTPDCSKYDDGETVPDSDSCSRYYVCVRGKAIKKNCNSGLNFDAVLGQCNRASSVDCELNRLGSKLNDIMKLNDDDYNRKDAATPCAPTTEPPCEEPTTTTPCEEPTTTTPCEPTTKTTTCKPTTTTTTCKPTTTTTTCKPTTTTTTCKPTTTTTTCKPTTTTTTCKPTTTTTTCKPTTTTTTCKPTTTTTTCKPKTTTTPCQPQTTTTTPCEPPTTTPPCEPSTTTPPCKPTTKAPCVTTTSPCTTTKASCEEATTTVCGEVESTTVENSEGNARFYVSSKDCTSLRDGTILVDANHCRRYYVCSNKRTKRHRCRSDKWFDRKTLSCRPRSQVTNCRRN